MFSEFLKISEVLMRIILHLQFQCKFFEISQTVCRNFAEQSANNLFCKCNTCRFELPGVSDLGSVPFKLYLPPAPKPHPIAISRKNSNAGRICIQHWRNILQTPPRPATSTFFPLALSRQRIS